MGPYDHVRGLELGTGTYSWNRDRAMLYAVGVGCGLQDNLDEMQFTTENTPGVEQQVVPGFLTTMALASGWVEPLGWGKEDEYPVGLVHGEQSVTLFHSIPPEGIVRLRRVIEGVYDKGSGALVVMDTEVWRPDSDELLGSHRMRLFAQGKGGFGGPRGPADEADDWTEPDREPDAVVSLPVGLNQSLIYRLMGDHREHGTVPENARADGFDRPVFYGLGTFGVACRAMVKGLCGGDVGRFGHIAGRFSKPVYPGDRLDALIWRDEGGARFRMLANGERLSLDRGRFRFR